MAIKKTVGTNKIALAASMLSVVLLSGFAVKSFLHNGDSNVLGATTTNNKCEVVCARETATKLPAEYKTGFRNCTIEGSRYTNKAKVIAEAKNYCTRKVLGRIPSSKDSISVDDRNEISDCTEGFKKYTNQNNLVDSVAYLCDKVYPNSSEADKIAVNSYSKCLSDCKKVIKESAKKNELKQKDDLVTPTPKKKNELKQKDDLVTPTPTGSNVIQNTVKLIATPTPVAATKVVTEQTKDDEYKAKVVNKTVSKPAAVVNVIKSVIKKMIAQ